VISWERVRRVAYRAAGDFVRFAVVVLIIRRRSVAVHGHDVGEHGAWPIVLIRVEKQSETLELVGVSEYVARLRALLGEPHGEAIAIEVSLTRNFELEFNLLA
jgi:hypothetical protein